MDDDPELAAIRARRLAEMQAQGGGVTNQEIAEKQQEAIKRENEMKNSMLSQILDQSARARLNSIALVKPEKAEMIENTIIQMARTRQLGGKNIPGYDIKGREQSDDVAGKLIKVGWIKKQEKTSELERYITLNEEGLIQLLERINKQTEKSAKVTINRRRHAVDSDDDDY